MLARFLNLETSLSENFLRTDVRCLFWEITKFQTNLTRYKYTKRNYLVVNEALDKKRRVWY